MAKSYLQIKEEGILKQAELLESIKHPVAIGGHLEELLLTFLKDELPSKYSVGSGFIIGLLKSKNVPYSSRDDRQEGKFRSKEIDIVIYDEQKNINPLKLYRKRDFYVEGTYAVISVKSNLTKSNFIEAESNMLDNLISAKEIKPDSFSYIMGGSNESTFTSRGGMVASPLLSIGFAYKGITLKTIKQHLESLIPKYKRWHDILPDIICVLQKGLVIKNRKNDGNYGYSTFDAQENALEELFFKLLSLLNNRGTFSVGIDAYRDFYQ